MRLVAIQQHLGSAQRSEIRAMTVDELFVETMALIEFVEDFKGESKR